MSTKYAFVLGTSLGLLAILVHSLVDFNMQIPANALIAVTFLALLSSHLRFASSDYWVGLGIPTKLLASILLLACVGALGWHSFRRVEENAWLTRAERADRFSPEQVKLLEKAFVVDPQNFETAQRIGEALRQQAAAGPANSVALAGQALDWFTQAMRLNRWDAGTCWRLGWCLDWLDKGSEAAKYFDRAELLDGNNYYVLANIGIHYLSVENPAAARQYFERSLHLKPTENDIATSYLGIINDRMQETARRLGGGLKASPGS